MSIHDETWDRPICEHCKKQIPYGESGLHREGKCQKIKPTSQQLLVHDYPLSLGMCPNEEDGPFDGACPCCNIHGQGFNVEVSCWRVNEGFSRIKVEGPLSEESLWSIAEHIRDNNGWTDRTDWQIDCYKTYD